MKLYEIHVLRKQRCFSFTPNLQSPGKEKLELVHSSVGGPTPVSSNGSVMYFITFIYDSPRKLWIYFQKNKSDVLTNFRIWKAMVEE